MSFKILISETSFVVQILQIQINAKFKAQLDIFIKTGSQKEELFSGLIIENGKVMFPAQKANFSPKEINKLKNSQTFKTPKKILLLFQLRSRTYNAYAGQVEINTSSKIKTKYQSKIENCIDEKARIAYEIFAQNNQMEKSSILTESEILQEKVYEIYVKPEVHSGQIRMFKQDPMKQNSSLKKKTPTSVESSRYKLNFKAQQKSVLSKVKSLPNSINGSLNASQIEKNVSMVSNSKKITEQQQLSLIESIPQKLSQSKKTNILLTSKISSQQITKKIFELQKRLNEQKQRSLKIEFQLQSKKLEIKQITKDTRSFEKKAQQLQTELKKVKKSQSSYIKQNHFLKDSYQNLKQKFSQKSQQLHLLNRRNKSHQKTYKEELKNVYQKLQTVCKEKEFKNYENTHLEERFQQVEKRFMQEIEQKEESYEQEKSKLEKLIKKLEGNLEGTKCFLVKSLKSFGQQIQDVLTRIDNDSEIYSIRKKNYLMDLSSFYESTTTKSHEENQQNQHNNKEYLMCFRDILLKVERISSQLHSNLDEKRGEIKRNEQQIKELKTELRQLCMEIQAANQSIIKDREKHKNELQKLSITMEEQRLQSSKKVKELKTKIKTQQGQINQLNQVLQSKNRQLSSLKIVKERLQQDIAKINQEMQQKTAEFKKNISLLVEEKEQMSKNFKAESLDMEGKMQKHRIRSVELGEKNINLLKTVQTLQKEIPQTNQKLLNSQKQLKLAQQSNHAVLKEMNELKNMISEITGHSSKKEKQILGKNQQLVHQVNNFKQNYKALQQTKNTIQSQLQKMQSEITFLRQQKAKNEQQGKKIEKIFNSNQKSSNSLRNMVLDMKKENEELKKQLKKKVEFQQQIQDEFQCNFYQIREKLDFFMKENKEIEKEKAGLEREVNLRTKKLNIIIDSLNFQLNKLMEFQTFVDNQNLKITQVVIELKKATQSFEASPGNGVLQMKQPISLLDKLLDQAAIKYAQLQQSLAQTRKNRSKNSVSLRRVSNADNLNKTLLKNSSSANNLSYEENNNNIRKINRNNSMMVTFGTNNEKKAIDNILSLQSIDEGLQKETEQNFQTEENKAETDSMILIQQAKSEEKRVGKGLKRLPSRNAALKAKTSQRMQTQIMSTNKKGIKRMPTLK